ncbi:MAG: META domain-containing protein [Bacteroidota bacterium]|nr:META domain-containing protein [Bacteroidota bacterium]MDP4213945.1 META domain-containing protein [Bacteroidota bacterium]MDP4248865.1 META domain-containing protein [Bacteroidota bacterium]
MHTKVKSFILIAALIAMLPALQAQTTPGRYSGRNATIQGKWYLRAVLSSDTSTGRVPEISFDLAGGHFTGNTGCNTMRGDFRISDSTLTIGGQIITTKMMCVGYNEAAFLKNLIRVNGYKIRNGMLVLMVDGSEVSRWSRKIIKPAQVLTT